MADFKDRLNFVIPGGAHTYSRGHDQFPINAPQIIDNAKGVYMYDPNGNEYLDYGMAVRSVNIGYAEDTIDNAVIRQIRKGVNFTRPSTIELEAAEVLTCLIGAADMVKFTKNGSTAVSAAVKLSRAYTGREIVARCEQHPFFSYDDWFIGSTPITRGVPKETINNTKTFKYNDINSLQSLIDEFPNQIACVVLEPATTECPAVGDFKDSCCGKLECDRMNTSSGRNFLQEVENLCNKNGIVFVLDEMITGFRWSKHGAQDLYGVTPDLSTFGKAMANGYAVACLAGKREIMELGAIDSPGEERVFLLSTTHGAEATSLSAFVETVKFISENNVIDHFWQYGFKLVSAMNEIARSYGIQNYFKAAGPSCSPYYLTLDNKGLNSLPLRTLFSQEMFKNGVSMPWIAIAYRHQNVELQKTINALEESLRIVAKATEVGVEKFLNGPAIKPVFRKFN